MARYKVTAFLLLLLIGCGSLSSTIKKEYVLRNNIGAKYIKLELWHDAKLHLLKALELAPQQAAIYNNLGIVYEYFNLKNKAKEAYQKAVKLAPQIPVYQKNLDLFNKECLNLTTTPAPIEQDLKEKDSSNIKIYTTKVTIKRKVEPKIKIDKINRVALFTFSKDEENKDAVEISKMIAEIFKIGVIERSPFYILEDYELKDLIQDGVVRQQDLDEPGRRETLNKILSTEGLFVVKINKFKDNRYKNFELKNYYSQEKKEFVYYHQPYIKRKVEISMSISFFNGITGDILWDKEYQDELSTTYLGDNEEVIPLFDRRLFNGFINKPVEDFITNINHQEKIYERIVVMER